MKKFAAHGRVQLSVEGRMLIARVSGPFNVEFVSAYMRALKPITSALTDSGPWGGITEFNESALFPLEMSAVLRDQTIIAVERMHMIANCWVIPPSVEGYGIVEKQGHTIYDGVLPFETFENSIAARAWLERQLNQNEREN